MRRFIKCTKYLLLLAVLLIITQAITAYIFSGIAAKQFDLELALLKKSAIIKVINHKFYKGWFSSYDELSISFNDNILKDTFGESIATDTHTIQFTINTSIYNGIFAGYLHGEFSPTIAYSSSEVIYPHNAQEFLGKIFGGKIPLQITQTIYLNQHGKYRIISPSLNYHEALSGATIVWHGMMIISKHNQSLDNFINQLYIPYLSLKAPTKIDLELTNLYMANQFSYSNHHLKVGKNQLQLEYFKLLLYESSVHSMQLAKVLHLLTGINKLNFLNNLEDIDEFNFSLNQLAYYNNSEDIANFFNMNSQLDVAHIASKNNIFGPLHTNFSIRHLDSAALDNILILLNQYLSNKQVWSLHEKQLKLFTTAILEHLPEVNLNRFYLGTQYGPVTLTANMKLLGAADSLDQLQQHAYLYFTFSMPQNIIANILFMQMQYLLTAGNAKLDLQSQQALRKVVDIVLDNQITKWQKIGYLTKNSTMISSIIKLESGSVIVNNSKRLP